MQFYKLEFEHFEKEEMAEEEKREQVINLSNNCMELVNELIGDDSFAFVAENSFYKAIVVLITKDNVSDVLIDKILVNISKENENMVKGYFEEITVNDFITRLNLADRRAYLNKNNQTMQKYRLGPFRMMKRLADTDRDNISEYIINNETQKNISSGIESVVTRKSLKEEVDRIFDLPVLDNYYGHPVHYIISADCDVDDTIDLLLKALYKQRRIKNRRYCRCQFDYSSIMRDKGVIKELYECNVGGAIIFDFRKNQMDESEFDNGAIDFIEMVCENCKKYQRNVLTIICLAGKSNESKKIIKEKLLDISVVEINESYNNYKEACEYFEKMASKEGVKTDDSLYYLIDKKEDYKDIELKRIFDGWYSNKLRKEIFYQYKDFDCNRTQLFKQEDRGDAYSQLNKMIGLESTKELIEQMLNSIRANKLFADRGFEKIEMSNHMIFTGNPGTAKTTVARLLAKILKDNGIIKGGHLVEVGRADLVGKYVGSTAPKVKSAFERAIGGILFIDEAYSLIDYKDGLYGDEAINTIVQEMENLRGQVIVIFAGYPDKMEDFLEKNPGLRSRINHHINFDDYDTEELVQIAKLMASENGLKLEKAAIDKMYEIFDEACKEKDFGNGRYVRNIIEKARMAQANRLMKMDVDRLTKKDIRTIRASDISAPRNIKEKEQKLIGFVS